MQHPFHTQEHEIRWSSLTPEHIETDIEKALSLAEERLQAIRDLKSDQLTYANTFQALESAAVELENAWGLVNHLDSVSNNEDQRAALNAMLPKVSRFYSSIPLDAKIWSNLRTFSESECFQQLNELEQRFIKETCVDFIQAGANLNEEKKARMAEIDAELAEVTQKFSENTLDSTNEWELILTNKSGLAGVPEMFIESARQDALRKNYGTEEQPQWRITLQQPSYYPILKHADDSSLREEIWHGLETVGLTEKYDNTQNVWKILELRQEKAELLGKKHFADVVLESRMAKSGENALKFTHDLQAKIKKSHQQEFQDLLAFCSEETGEKVESIDPWDALYWSEKMRQKLYDFDEMELRPYFEVNQVMQGMFTIFSQLFQVRIEEVASCVKDSEKTEQEGDGNGKQAVETWHKECNYYRLFDAESNEHLGSFYADWHPRSTKRGGAWMNPLFTGEPQADGTLKPHIGLIVGNMTKPTKEQPALLNHREVETIFHEFGHLLHHLLGNSPIRQLSGMNVPWDFVELPSQILENWCWDREALDLFAKHYETGETIPEELYKKMHAAKNFNSASIFMMQLGHGKIDLELHVNYKKYAGRNLDEVDREILKDYRNLSHYHTPTMLRKFSHLFSSPTGYAAGYYSYKWAEVLDADAFSRFSKEGILNPTTGKSFRDEVLAKGNTRSVDASYRAFMGRDPEQEALLVRSGIIKEA